MPSIFWSILHFFAEKNALFVLNHSKSKTSLYSGANMAYDEVKINPKRWVDDYIENAKNIRDEKWIMSIAVGNPAEAGLKE